MPPLNEIIAKDPLRILPYGMSGAGKTTLIGRLAEFPDLRPIYIFDWDLRIGTLKATIPQDLWQFILSDPYRDQSIGGEAFTRMQAMIEKLPSMNVKTAVIDSGTFMMKGIMNRVLQLDGKAVTSVPQLQHYNQEISIFEELISRICGKNINFIMTCHETTLHDELGGRVYKAVDLTGKKAPNRIPGYFNEFWHCEVRQLTGREPEFIVRTRSDQTFAARTSYKSLLNEEPQSTVWQKILKERLQTQEIINRPQRNPPNSN